MAEGRPLGVAVDRQRLHGQGPLQRVAQRAGVLPRRAGRPAAGAGRPRRRGDARPRGPVRLGRGRDRLAHRHRPRRRRRRRHLPPRAPPRRGGHRGARGRQARAGREAAGQHRRRGREDAGGRPGGARARRAVDGRLQLPPRAGPGAGPRPGRLRPAGRRTSGQGGLPPGLARRRRRPDDVADAQGDRRVGRARRPRLARGRPGAVPARRRTWCRCPAAPRRSSADARGPTGSRTSRSTTPPGRRCARRVGRWPRSR